jgi:hypothetical protein
MDEFNRWGAAKKGADHFEKMRAEVINPQSSKVSSSINGFLAKVNGGYVVSGDETVLMNGLSTDILANFMALAPVIFEKGVNSSNDQPMVMTAAARAAQLVGTPKGQSVSVLMGMLIKEQLPDYGYQYVNGRLEINSSSINAIRNLQKLFAAFQRIAAAA